MGNENFFSPITSDLPLLELEKIYPELVHELNGKGALKSIDYLGLIPVLVDLLQQQQKEIEALKKTITK